MVDKLTKRLYNIFCLVNHAGLVKWYHKSFPNLGQGFDPPIPLQTLGLHFVFTKVGKLPDTITGTVQTLYCKAHLRRLEKCVGGFIVSSK